VLALEFVDKVSNQSVVEVLTTQVSVTSSGLDLKDTLLNGKERNIESTTTEIEDENVSLTLDLLVQTVGDSGSGRLVDDSEDVEASDETRVLGSLSLGVVEVGWDSDDGVLNLGAEISLRGLSHLDKNHRRDFLWGELLGLALEFYLNYGLAGLVDDLECEVLHISLNVRIAELSADKSLSVEDSVVRVHGNLVLCGISNETLGVGESHEGRGSSVTLVICNDVTSRQNVSNPRPTRNGEIWRGNCSYLSSRKTPTQE
jgi:hypothetical protein